jgi:iron complex transport system permease protein
MSEATSILKKEPIHDKSQHKKTINGKLVFTYIALAVLMVFFIIMSLCYGGYKFDFFTVAQVVFARFVNGIVWALGLPSVIFAPYTYTLSPLTNYIESVFQSLSTLVHPVQQSWPDWINVMVWDVRFPREILVILVGGGLAISGATFQGSFRNPLVSENILGVSSAASFGATLGILITTNSLIVQVMAFAFGLMSVIFTFSISKVYKTNSTILLVLTGIIIASVFTAATTMVEYLANPITNQLSTIVFWLMGSFGQASYGVLFTVGPIIIFGIVVLLLVRWHLNVMSMGDEEARAMGLDIGKFRILVILCATMITAAAVSICGTISWVGLVVPHLARMIAGPDHTALLPLTIVMGAAYMLLVDLLCLSLTTAVIPTNILTSLIGVPVFLVLLLKSKNAWA